VHSSINHSPLKASLSPLSSRAYPEFPASPLSLATTYVVLPKENHMQSTEAATLDGKSGEAEGSACAPRVSHILEFSRRLYRGVT
jgi:hypothetical protein